VTNFAASARVPGARAILELVERTGRWLQVSWMATGLEWTVAALFGALVVTVVVDLLLPMGVGLRLLSLALVLALPAGVYVATVKRPMARGLTPSRVARRMETQLPGIRNRLVSCVELLGNGQGLEQSVAFERRLVVETAKWLEGFQPKQVVDWTRLQWGAGFAFAAVIVVAGLLLVWPYRTLTALTRIAVPWADIPPVASVAYAVFPGDTKLLRGDDLTLVTRVERGAPRKLQVEIHPDKGGKPLRYDLGRRDNGEWTFTLSGYERSFAYRVVGGGTWSKTHRVAVLERPAIVELHTLLHLPAYMGVAEPQVGPPQVADVTGPESSHVEVVAQVKGDVARGEIQRVEIATNGVESVASGVLPMTNLGAGKWSGKFMLTSNGYYRVEFQNELGHANKQMSPARFTAIPDVEPQVRVERPGTDIVVGEKDRVPLVIAATDDYGLEQVSVLVTRVVAGTNLVTRLPVKSYPVSQTSDAALGMIDVAGLGLKKGESAQYAAVATDRKGLTARSRDFALSVTAEGATAEQQLTTLTEQPKQQTQQLSELIAGQEAMRARLGELAVEYDPLLNKIESALGGPRPAPEVTTVISEPLTATNPPMSALKIEFDPAETEALKALREKLGVLATAQQQYVQQATLVAVALSNAVLQAAGSPMLPAGMADQLRWLQQSFEQTTLAPMLALGRALQQGASPEFVPSDPEQLAQMSARLGEQLQALSAELAQWSRAAQQMTHDPSAAMRELQQVRTRTQARMMSGELRYLEDQLGSMVEEMQRLQGAQEKLFEKTSARNLTELEPVEEKQELLEEEMDPLLTLLQEIQGRRRLQRVRHPRFADAPYAPDHGEYLVPPQEEDTPEPEEPKGKPTPEERAAQIRQLLKEPEPTEDDEPLYMPALGGEEPRLNPRFAKKLRPVRGTKGDHSTAEEREELRSRQWARLMELDLARQSTAADRQVVGQLMEQLRQASRVNKPLDEVVQSPAMAEAMALADRLQQVRGQAVGRTGRLRMYPGGGSGSGGGLAAMGLLLGEEKLPELNLNERTVILNMQPQLREELLQGMQEEGPEPYRKFIRDYFEQLTKVK